MENAVAAKDEEATDDNVTEVDSADDNVTQCEEEVETATVVPGSKARFQLSFLTRRTGFFSFFPYICF